MRTRDNQRSRVYEWERHASKTARLQMYMGDMTLEEAVAWATPIWRSERGRVGLAKVRAPSIERPHWGQRSALAHPDHRITLPRWARNKWVVLHELAHRLTPHDEAHGPRFVGVLIGLVCRHIDGLDADWLMRLADEHGVKYYVKSIGVVPVRGLAWHVERAIASNGPMTPMDAACWLSLADGVEITERQVRGAVLPLIRAGRCRYLRHKLTITEGAST